MRQIRITLARKQNQLKRNVNQEKPGKHRERESIRHARQSVHIAGIRVCATTAEEATNAIIETSKNAQSISFHFANAWTVALASKNSALKNILNANSVVYPDGKPLTFFAKIKDPAAHHVRGPSTFENVLLHGQSHGTRHFLLGSTPETLDGLAANLEDRYPAARIVGVYSPPFRPMTSEEVRFQDSLIKNSHADIVWVGLGTPKQDFEAHRIAESTGVVAAAVGAAFDFSAGSKRVASPWMTSLGLEWLFRLLTEPRRLWKRYLIGNLVFLKEVFLNWRDK